MKPSRNIKNKVTTENKLSSTIQHYFKTAPKECVEEKGCTASESKCAYIQILKDKLMSYDDETESDNITNESPSIQENDEGTVALQTELVNGNNAGAVVLATEVVNGNDADATASCDECNVWRTKYQDLKKSHVKLSLRHCELQMKFDDLVKITTSTVQSNTNEVSDALSPDGIFTQNEIRCLQSLGLEKKKDSTFFLQCIQYAYKENPTTLQGKTLKGTLEKTEIKDDGSVEIHPAKDPLTPEKVNRIEKLFIDRVTKNSKMNSVEFGERVKQTNINKLFASAIKNVANKNKPHEKASNQNVDLNL